MAKRKILETVKKTKFQTPLTIKLFGEANRLLNNPQSREQRIYHNNRRMEFLKLNLKNARSAAEKKTINDKIKSLVIENAALQKKRLRAAA